MSIVLLVEDQPTNRKLIRDILQIQFEVAEAESAEVALDWLRDHRPDLILMDLQLPGMDGVTLTSQLKSDPVLRQVPVIAVSALALPRDMEEARSAGCCDYITKPITDEPAVFLERISRFLMAAS